VVLRAYPSTADAFAKLLDACGERLQLKAVITGSEPLYLVQRERIESVFGCKVFDFYGMAERIAYAAECEFGHLHLNTDYSYVEILDPKGQPTDDIGSIVGTTLRNSVMPLLRYRISDNAKWVPGHCACGRTYPRIELSSGKVEDQLFDVDAMPISASVITFAFKGVSNIAKAQVAQVGREHWEVRVIPDRNFTEADGNQLIRNLKGFVSSSVNYTLRIQNEIHALPSGKYKWVSQEWSAR
jgi:phenylacetate-CoA ligase